MSHPAGNELQCKVRIIFARKKQHLTVATVIDLQQEYQCDCTLAVAFSGVYLTVILY